MANHFLEISDGVTFLKLHGSCNFLPRGIVFNNVALRFQNIIAANLDVVDSEDVIRFCHSGRSDYPVMCMFMEGKPAQIGGNKIRDIQARWTEYVADAKRVLIIGVKPHMTDRHIWEPLSSTSAKIGYVGSKSRFDSWVLRA